MKKVLIIFAFAFTMCFMANAAQKKSTFDVSINCQKCVERIMSNLDQLGGGITLVEANLPTHQLVITYDDAVTNDAKIVEGLQNLHFRAFVAEEGKAPRYISGRCDNCEREGGDKHHEGAGNGER